MTYDLRTIALMTEVIFPPMELRPQKVQALHNELFSDTASGYQNFAISGNAVVLSNAPMRPGWVSTATFLPDRIQVREELTGATLEDFKGRLTSVLGRAQQELSIPMAAASQCVVRSLVNPRHFADSRDFLARGMARFDERSLSSFGRPASCLGLKFLFPQTPQTPSVFSIRIESFNEDPRSLFLENVGTFTHLPFPGGIPQVADQLQQTYDFILRSTCEFLSRFDVPGRPGGGMQ